MADIEPHDIPRPPQDWWSRVPVLNELYKLLSNEGPVNWELATQVGTALASFEEPVCDLGSAGRELEGMSRAAQVQVEAFTGLPAGSVVPVQAVTREQWVQANIESFSFLMEPLARKLTGGGLPGIGGLPPGLPVPEQALTVIRQVGAVFMGLQTGMVMGYLARHVLGQYELTLPQPEGGRLLYVVPNLAMVEADWELDERDFRYWIALHEVTHHLEFSRPWARKYFHGQLTTLIESLDFDPARLSSVLGDFDISDPEKLMETLSNPEQLIQAAWTPLGKATASKLQAFLTLCEGYATFVMDAVGADVLKDHTRLREVMDRRKREQSAGEVLLERLLGLELKRRQYEEGVKFCRYVAGMRDVAALNRAWDSPDSLPTEAEIADPDAWIARVLEGGGEALLGSDDPRASG